VNGQVDSSNKSILKIIRIILDRNKKSWDSKLRMVAWADRITVKKEIGKSHFKLVYGTQERISLQNILPAYNFILQEDLDIPKWKKLWNNWQSWMNSKNWLKNRIQNYSCK
jgi:hypothetical protein